MKSLLDLKIKLYADGADKAGILDLYAKPYVKGLTTNPTLMRKAGIRDYEAFARDILQTVTDKPISFEVFSDEFAEMHRQALKIASWGENVYVKIPITNSRGESAMEVVRELSAEGVKLNITALMTRGQVATMAEVLSHNAPSIVSVFAGRIADTGVDPRGIIDDSVIMLCDNPKTELLWASCREVLNIFQAYSCGCGIITVPHDILAKAVLMYGKDLEALSLETVRMFARDAAECGFRI